jgi:hypothetical protein
MGKRTKKMQKTILVSIVLAGIGLFFASTSSATVPAPPVNQTIGTEDVLIADLSEADCRACHVSGVPDRHHMLYGLPIPPGSFVPYPDGSGIYTCVSCHSDTFIAERNCVTCHTGSPHHKTADADAGDCQLCHGSIVDNMDDGHYIPTYAPSLVTPTRSLGDGLPLNSHGSGAGACNYCHDDDGLLMPVILTNMDLHHLASFNNFGSKCGRTDQDMRRLSWPWFAPQYPGRLTQCGQCRYDRRRR